MNFENIDASSEEYSSEELIESGFMSEEEYRRAQRILDDEFVHDARLKKILQREKGFQWVLEMYGIKVPFERRHDGIYHSRVPKDILRAVPQLTSGYGFKGGVARFVLEKMLWGKALPFRDVDIVRIDTKVRHSPFLDRTQQTSAVDPIEDWRGDYFLSRDFTINEIVLVGDIVYATEACIVDTLRGIVRPTTFEKQQSTKLQAKALRFIAERMTNSSYRAFDTADEWLFEPSPAFDVAIHLDRALERGGDVAERYINELIKRKMLPPTVRTPDELIRWATESTNFIFRFVPQDVKKQEVDISDDMDDAWEHLPLRESHRHPRT